jgi:hypothetical protein
MRSFSRFLLRVLITTVGLVLRTKVAFCPLFCSAWRLVFNDSISDKKPSSSYRICVVCVIKLLVYHFSSLMTSRRQIECSNITKNRMIRNPNRESNRQYKGNPDDVHGVTKPVEEAHCAELVLGPPIRNVHMFTGILPLRMHAEMRYSYGCYNLSKATRARRHVF